MLDNSNIFKGKWLIKYNPDEFNYTDILEFLYDIIDWIEKNNLQTKYKYILFDKEIKENTFYINRNDTSQNKSSIFINFKNNILENLKKIDTLNYKKLNFKKKRNIKNILLMYPVLLTDKRWDTIDLTASSLFLGSSLKNNEFNIDIKKQILPYTNINKELIKYDLIGLTLFEDTFLETKEFLSNLKENYKGLIAAGGPLITLNPIHTACYLSEINLIVRGESELIISDILNSINKKTLNELFEFKGLFFKDSGIILISDINKTNRPENFNDFRFNIDFLKKEHIKNGLEINLSRGCKRSCIFCSKVQGKTLRKLPEEKFEYLLKEFESKINKFGVTSPLSKTININDDDILQDIDYAKNIFSLIKKFGFKLWGIQTSINSFFNKKNQIEKNIIELIDDRDIFVKDQPMVWLGTDTFLRKRGSRLGKSIPHKNQIENLIYEFEKREIMNYHFWITSDYNSNWQEFINEFIFIYDLYNKFKRFEILAHSPFLIPYSTTPLFKFLKRSKKLMMQVKYKEILKSKKDVLYFPLVERLETRYIYLNRLLKNEVIKNDNGFFTYLKKKDFLNAFLTAYDFLKKERIYFESLNILKESSRLIKIEKRLEQIISKRI